MIHVASLSKPPFRMHHEKANKMGGGEGNVAKLVIKQMLPAGTKIEQTELLIINMLFCTQQWHLTRAFIVADSSSTASHYQWYIWSAIKIDTHRIIICIPLPILLKNGHDVNYISHCSFA